MVGVTKILPALKLGFIGLTKFVDFKVSQVNLFESEFIELNNFHNRFSKVWFLFCKFSNSENSDSDN
jgi:hypothetical protein